MEAAGVVLMDLDYAYRACECQRENCPKSITGMEREFRVRNAIRGLDDQDMDLLVKLAERLLLGGAAVPAPEAFGQVLNEVDIRVLQEPAKRE